MEEQLSLKVFDLYSRRSEMLHLHRNEVKQSPLFDRWPIVRENLINLPCFAQVNHLLLSKRYEKTSGETTLTGTKRLSVGAKRP